MEVALALTNPIVRSRGPRLAGGTLVPEPAPYREFASFYDRLMGDAMFPLVRRNFESLVRRYGLRFRSAADVACGTGTFVRYLCGLGAQVFGVDRSRSMLLRAIRKNRGNRAMFLLQDMRELLLPFRVDLITCHFDSMNYLLSHHDLALTLSRFCTNLSFGGHAIFDMVTDFAEEPKMGGKLQLLRPPAAYSVWLISWQPERLLRSVEMLNFIREGGGRYRLEREFHVQRQYPIGVVVRIARNCGLAVRGVHDAHSLALAGPQTYRAVYVVRKP